MTKTESPFDRNLDNKHLPVHLDEYAPPADPQPWHAEQVRVWRESQPRLSVWQVLAAQALVAVFFASVVALWFGKVSLGWSWLYGALTVVIPAALFARGLTSRATSMNAFSAALGLMVWQSVKWVLAVVFLVLAPKTVPELSWPALLAGLVVTMKVYWLALAWGNPRAVAGPSTGL